MRRYINFNRENTSVYLTNYYNKNTNISPEEAFTFLKHYKYSTSNDERKIIWDIINDIEGYDDINYYGFCVTISEDYYNRKGEDWFTEVKEFCDHLGGYPDYILVRRKGILNLIHQSINIETLKGSEYIASEQRLEDGGGSFSIGLYVLGLKHNEHLVGKSNFYTGVYEGYYYECIDDLSNGEKCGSLNKNHKEFFIPRGVENIKWD